MPSSVKMLESTTLGLRQKKENSCSEKSKPFNVNVRLQQCNDLLCAELRLCWYRKPKWFAEVFVPYECNDYRDAFVEYVRWRDERQTPSARLAVDM